MSTGVHQPGHRARLRPPLRADAPARGHRDPPLARRHGPRSAGWPRVVVLQVVVLGGVGLALGWRPDGASLGWALLLIVLGAAAFGACGLLLGGSVRADLVLVIANVVWFVLLLRRRHRRARRPAARPARGGRRAPPQRGARRGAARGAARRRPGVGHVVVLVVWGVRRRRRSPCGPSSGTETSLQGVVGWPGEDSPGPDAWARRRRGRRAGRDRRDRRGRPRHRLGPRLPHLAAVLPRQHGPRRARRGGRAAPVDRVRQPAARHRPRARHRRLRDRGARSCARAAGACSCWPAPCRSAWSPRPSSAASRSSPGSPGTPWRPTSSCRSRWCGSRCCWPATRGRWSRPPRPARSSCPARCAGLTAVSAAVLTVLIVVGTLVTAAGPHAGDPTTPRLTAFSVPDLAMAHAHLLFAFLGLLVGLGVPAARGRRRPGPSSCGSGCWCSSPSPRACSAAPSTRSASPRSLVALHVLGAMLVTAAIAWLWAATTDPAGTGPSSGTPRPGRSRRPRSRVRCMRAVRVEAPGGPEVLVPTEVGEPVVGRGRRARRDRGRAASTTSTPTCAAGSTRRRCRTTPGLEGAGVVRAVGAAVTDLVVGDRVAFCDGPRRLRRARGGPGGAVRARPRRAGDRARRGGPAAGHDGALPGPRHPPRGARRDGARPRGRRRDGPAAVPDGRHPRGDGDRDDVDPGEGGPRARGRRGPRAAATTGSPTRCGP